MKLGKQQKRAVNSVVKWLKEPEGKQVFRLFGFAGVGKTTIAKYIEELACEIFDTKRPAVYGAYTGKAAMVLTKKKCKAHTIHSLLYKPMIDEETGRVLGYTYSPTHAIKRSNFIVIDEGSMVNEEIGKDLENTGKLILVLADPFQLPPVEGTGYFMGEPDALLTKIHRNAEDSPIIHMATLVRRGEDLEYGRYGDSRVIRNKSLKEEMLLEHEQVLCGTNNTRYEYNRVIRKLKDHTSSIPEPGEKLICLKNDKDLGTINGGMWNVTRQIHNDQKKFKLALQSLDPVFDEEPANIEVNILKKQFDAPFNTVKEIEPRELKGYGQFDYGNVITTHKAQGSEFSSVLVFNENYYFRDMSQRWLYTAITRSSERLTLIGR